MHKLFASVAFCALALNLGACGTLTPLTGNPAADAKAAVANINTNSTDQLTTLTKGLGQVTDALNARCNGAIGLTWNPPLPPIPSVNVYCPIGIGTGAVSMQTLKALTASPPAPAAPPAPPPAVVYTIPLTPNPGPGGTSPGFD